MEKVKELKVLGHDAIQQKVFEYLWNNYPESRRCFWHTPNELTPDNYVQQAIAATKKSCPSWIICILKEWQKRFLIKLSKRKSIGVLAGVTDLVFYWKGVLYMFDIKIGSDTLSDAQKAFILANKAQGGMFFEISSVDQGIDIINSIFES